MIASDINRMMMLYDVSVFQNLRNDYINKSQQNYYQNVLHDPINESVHL